MKADQPAWCTVWNGTETASILMAIFHVFRGYKVPLSLLPPSVLEKNLFGISGTVFPRPDILPVKNRVKALKETYEALIPTRKDHPPASNCSRLAAGRLR